MLWRSYSNKNGTKCNKPAQYNMHSECSLLFQTFDKTLKIFCSIANHSKLITNSMELSILERPLVVQPLENLPAFCGSQRLINASVLDFLEVSHPLAFPPITYMCSSSAHSYYMSHPSHPP
jgi:hypothetical protein